MIRIEDQLKTIMRLITDNPIIKRFDYSSSLLRFTLSLFLVVLAVSPSMGDDSPERINQAIKEYFQTIENVSKDNIDSRVRTIRQKASFFEKEGFDKAAFMARLSAGELLMLKPDHKKALDEFEEAIEIAERTHDIQRQGLTLLKIGELEADRANLDQAVAKLERARTLVAPVGDKRLLGRIDTQIGGIQALRGNLDEALKALAPAGNDLKDTDDNEYLALNLRYMGDVFTVKNRFEDATKAYSQAMETAGKAGWSILENIILTRKALVMLDMERPKEALKLISEALEKFQDESDQRFLAWAKTVEAKILITENKLEKAATILKECEKPLEKDEAKIFKILYHQVRALGLSASGELADADEHISKSLKIANELKLAPAALESKIIHGTICSNTGRLLVGLRETKEAIDKAREFEASKSMARAIMVNGLLNLAAKNFSQAYSDFDAQLNGNNDIPASWGLKKRCVLYRGECLAELGFPHQAYLDGKKLLSETDPKTEPHLNNGAKILMAKCHVKAGAHEKALKILREVIGPVSNLKNPLPLAEINMVQARVLQAQGYLEAAYQKWDLSEKILANSNCDETAMECRSEKVKICLDINNLKLARSNADSKFSVFWAKGNGFGASQDMVISDDGVHRPHLFLAQFPTNIGPQGPGSKSHWEALESVEIPTTHYRSEPRLGKDKDADRIICGYKLMRAEVKRVDNDPEKAQKISQEAIEILGDKQPVNRPLKYELERTLAMCLAAQGKFQEACDVFEGNDLGDLWLRDFFSAMAVMKKGKPVKAANTMENALAEMMGQEKQFGLWDIHPYKRRERENIFEGLIMAHIRSAKAKKESEPFKRAWQVAQKLKMRRVLYQLFGASSVGVPGLPRPMALGLRNAQYFEINSRLQKKAEKLRGSHSVKGLPWDNSEGEYDGWSVEDMYRAIEDSKGPLAGILKCEPPSVEMIIEKLGKNESYISFLVTNDRVFGFRLSEKGVSAAIARGGPKELIKKTQSVIRQASNPYRLRVTKDSSELYQDLLASIGFKHKPGQDVVLEVDGFLWTLPFEALLPGEFPSTYKERLAAELVFDNCSITRTTSAFRFHGQRNVRSGAESKRGIFVFANPELDPIVKSRNVQEGTVKRWKESVSEFVSSSANRVWSSKDIISQIIGASGKAYLGKASNVKAFLGEETVSSPVVHFVGPALAPEMGVGHVRQPTMVFSPKANDISSGFCGPDLLLSKKRENSVLTLVWLNESSYKSPDGFILMMELLGLSGIDYALAPLWSVNSRYEKDWAPLTREFYKLIIKGAEPSDAYKKALQGMVVGEKDDNGNRLKWVRYAIF